MPDNDVKIDAERQRKGNQAYAAKAALAVTMRFVATPPSAILC